jgi:hypothetical protein
MGKKLSIEEVRKIVESKGGELISTEYGGTNVPITIKTSDGEIETRCLTNIYPSKKLISKKNQIKSLSDKSRLSIDQVRKIIESKGGELLSTEYVNDLTPIKIKFSDGEIEERSLCSIRSSEQLISMKEVIENRRQNNKLSLNEIKNIVERRGGKLLSTTIAKYNDPIKIQTIDGVIEERGLVSIRKLNKLYSKEYIRESRFEKQRHTIEDVRKIVESRGGELISTEYKNNKSPIRIKTVDGIIEDRNLSNIKWVDTLISNGSVFQYEITKYIKSIYSGTVLNNDRIIIAPNELDIVLPDKKLAIECNGVYWHSDTHKDKNYHLNKTLVAENNGYNVIHITDSEWGTKKDIVKDLIKKKLDIINQKIPARKCEIKELSHNISSEFLNKNHLQGSIPSKYRYGLFYNNELVSVMTISNSRFSKDAEYELYRFSNKLGITVLGGFSKLFKYFIIKVNPESIISYCDIAYFSGSIYFMNGFKLIRRSTPNYKYFHINNIFELYSRNKFQKHKLPKLLETFDPNLSEYKNMMNNGYYRIWDCGNDVYLWKPNTND